MTGKVYLVGAGPGDPELLTLKALRLLQAADVLFYDRLVGHEILDLVRSACKKIYVGKEDGKHLIPQAEINQLLLKFAKKYPTVVRLKGGDPFVFGRGAEEALALKQQGIAFEIVPGISSCISAPAYAGIPVTMRNKASSFTVVTGHEAANKENSSINWSALAQMETLVFLMGVHQRQSIAQNLIEAGRSPDEAVAFIERGTTSQQRVYCSSLAAISRGDELAVASPAIMLVGEVSRCHGDLSWFEPEMGKEIGIA